MNRVNYVVIKVNGGGGSIHVGFLLATQQPGCGAARCPGDL
jgi:hypothetical protein